MGPACCAVSTDAVTITARVAAVRPAAHAAAGEPREARRDFMRGSLADGTGDGDGQWAWTRQRAPVSAGWRRTMDDRLWTLDLGHSVGGRWLGGINHHHIDRPRGCP